jgi:NAD(P)-dependent dehydrogenase (short-subunit alcohol dehydrogenase family)
MPQLADRVVVITGANQGIGAGIARLFASEGARLVIGARNAEKLDAVARQLSAGGADVLACPVDVTSEASVDRFIDAAVARHGRVDVLVNNAGAFDGARVDQLSLAAWNNVLGACLTGAFLCTRKVFGIMQRHGGGRILNIGSISAQRPREGSAAYTAAKFGVWGLTQATALDGRPFGIVCSCLHPGNVLVERRQDTGAAADEEPMMGVETIARAALAMVALPLDVNMLEAIVLPVRQLYLGRG